MITVETDPDAAVAVVTVDRHERRNALDTEHCRALAAAVGQAVADGARALVLTGRGSSFCAGADLDTAYDAGFRAALYDLLHGLVRVPIPLVAAVNGPAIGAGTQLAAACDLRVAGPSATFAVPTARNGLAVDTWTVRRLVGLLGAGTASRLLVGCDTLDLATAEARGLVDRRGELDVARAWAAQLARLAPLSLAFSKEAIRATLDPGVEVAALQALFDGCWASADVREAALARAEKRPPVFRGR